MTRVHPTEPASNTVRSYPRSLEQAFGPYARRSEIVPMPDEHSPFDLSAYRARRSRAGHWADQHQAAELPPCDMPIPREPQAQPRPAWPLLACFGFPFLLALVVWLVLTSLKP